LSYKWIVNEPKTWNSKYVLKLWDFLILWFIKTIS
jgi:hypothetical protein